MRLGDAQNVLRREVNIDLVKEDTVLLKESDLYGFLMRCKKPKVEPFMEWVVKTILPREVQKLTSTIDEKDAAIALLNDDLQNRNYENVALQAQKDIYQAELQECQDTIIHLKTRYVPHAKDPDKGNIIIIERKHTTPVKDKYHDLPYHIAKIQRCKRYVRLRWFDRHFPDHEVIVEIGNPNSVHMFNRFEEEGHAKQKYNHFRLIDLTREELYTMGVHAILDDEEEE